MEPLELVRNVTTGSGDHKSRPPSPYPPRHPQRRASSHVYPPDWLFWTKPPHGSRRFSLRMGSLGRTTSSKSNDEARGAQTNGVPEIDATCGIPHATRAGPPSSSEPPSPLIPTTTAGSKRHSTAWHYLHSIVTTNTTLSSPSSRDTATQSPSSPTTASDTPLAAMSQPVRQASPAPSTNPLPPSFVAPEPSASPAVSESPAPPSAHDAVVDSLLQRPPIVHRSNSTPAPEPAFTELHRTRSGDDSPDSQPRQEDVQPDSRLVSAMLNGPLDAGGGRVTRALGSQIEAVLSAQVEIGRAHLALEGIGAAQSTKLDLVTPTSGDEEGSTEKAAEAVAADEADLARRQQGVEDIMARLSELATSLKSYHAIGTPALIFPPTLPRRPVTAPAVSAPKPRMPQVTIATPDVARNESVPTSTDSLPVPESRTAFPTISTANSTAAPSPTSPTGPGLPRAPRGAALWLRKNAVNAAAVAVDSPTEMTPGERQRPW